MKHDLSIYSNHMWNQSITITLKFTVSVQLVLAIADIVQLESRKKAKVIQLY